MSFDSDPAPPISASSTAQNFTDDRHLDFHYQLAQPEYDACIEAIGIHAGWRLLDAGCGNGAFVPILSRLVGADGLIHAVDIAPEHIERINARAAQQGYACPVTAYQGSLMHLPLAHAAYDGVWSANVSQYLTDTELTQSLAEFHRVLRPGGIVAIKEFDLSCWHYPPLDVRLFWRLFDSLANVGAVQVLGTLRSVHMSEWLRKSGFTVLTRKSYVVERWAPLAGFHDHHVGLLQWLAQTAQSVPLSDADKAAWQDIQTHAASIVHDNDFCSREMFVVTVGQKPRS